MVNYLDKMNYLKYNFRRGLKIMFSILRSKAYLTIFNIYIIINSEIKKNI